MENFKQTVIEFFSPFYKDVDEAHGLPHVTTVMELALRINKELNLKLSERNIIIASIGHDMFSYTKRGTHHTEGLHFILGCNKGLFKNMCDEDRFAIAYAIGEHRGSYKGGYYSLLSEVISAADRGLPELDPIVERIYLTAKHNNSKFTNEQIGDLDVNDEDAVIELTFKHLVNKYGHNGYARYTDVYLEMFGIDLMELKNTISDFTLESFKEYVENNISKDK